MSYYLHGNSFAGFGVWFWVLIILIGVGVWGLLVLGIVWLTRASRRPTSTTPVPMAQPRYPMTPAEAILADRFARGEVGEDEFRARMAALRGEPAPGQPPASPDQPTTPSQPPAPDQPE